jgi:hypothetical protein
MLPESPTWRFKTMDTVYPTKKPITFFYRDAVDCVQSLVSSPLMKDHFQFTPFRVFKTAEKIMRVYSEWMSGNSAWEMQVSIRSTLGGF